MPHQKIILSIMTGVIAVILATCSATPADTAKAATDTTAPVLTVLSPTNGQEIGSNQTICGTVTDDNSGVDKIYIQIELDPAAEVAVSNGYWATNVSYTNFGTKTIQLYARDLAGNTSAPTVLSVDRQAIPFAIITNMEFGQVTSNARYNTKGICGVDSPYTVNNVIIFVITNNATNAYTSVAWNPTDWKEWLDLQPDTNWIFVNAAADNGKSNYSAPMMIIRDAFAPVPYNFGTVNIGNLHETTMNVSWGRATDNYTLQSDIMYRLLLVRTSDGVTNTPVTWTPDVTSFNCTGLTVNTTYQVYVQARDSVWNISNYYVWTKTTPDETPPVPTNVGYIDIQNNTTNGFQMIWGRANDNVSAKGNIQYLVVRSYSSNLTSPDTAEANGTIISNWATYPDDTVTNTLTGLLDTTTYYVNVVARDESGNRSVYVCRRTATLSADGPLPVPGNGGIFSGTPSGNNVILTWTKATDVNTPQTSLQYKVYYSASDNIDTVSNILANGSELTAGWRTDTNTWTYGPLAAHSMTYYNILVRDASGNISNYTMYMHYQM